jgi:hypothetical protein
LHKGKIQAGFFPVQFSSFSSSIYGFNLSAAANRFALSFVPEATKTLSKVTIYLSGVTGTLGANDLVADLFSDSASNPGTSIESRNTVTTTPTGAGRCEWTGFTSSITAGTKYWFVVKNVNATPATNYATCRYFYDYVGPYDMAGSSGWGWSKKESTNGGTSWTNTYYMGIILRLEYSDGTFEGFPIDSITDTDTSAQTVYSSRESGNRLITPNIILNVKGLSFFVGTGGTPTGDLRYRIYNGTNLLGTTNSIPEANIADGSTMWRPATFASNIIIPPLSDIRVVMSETSNSDASSNRYYSYKYVMENNANTLNLKPFMGSLQRTYFDGSSWVETNTDMIMFIFILDDRNPFLNNRFKTKFFV